MSGLFDVGLQPERTALAWRRTGLALLGGSLVAGRILPEVLGAWTVALGLIGEIVASLLLVTIGWRYRTHYRHLSAGSQTPAVTDGRLIAATAFFCVAAGFVSLVLVLSRVAVHADIF